MKPYYNSPMKPYYDQDGITIYHGDCRDVLPMLDAASIDAVVTDPPWKATAHPFVRRRPGDGLGVAPSRLANGVKYGDIGRFDKERVALSYAASSADVLIMCGYLELQDVLSVVGKLRGVFVWHNPRPCPIPGPVAARDVSFIVWGGERSKIDPKRERWASSLFPIPSLQGGCMATERIQDADGKTFHPAQEPLALITRLLLPLGEGTILDPFMGTGTTLRAAKDLGRTAIGIEIEERYCELAAKRLAQNVFAFPND